MARNIALGNPIGRKAVAFASHKGVVAELSKGSVDDQTSRLNEMVGLGTLSSGKLAESIKKNAPKEMDKAIKKYKKENRMITVDTLLEDVREQTGFLNMCNKVGITYQWFEELASNKMKEHKIGV